MDKRTIETEATSAVRTLIRRNPYLSPYIDENDKTPVWDGAIYVYSTSNSGLKNKALLGRVPTQIKGHNTKEGFPDQIKYPINKTDLKAYQSEGGLIFIVVYIDDLFNPKIYYEQLLPLDIERLLSLMKSQESKLISLKQIPQDNLQLANLFLNFVKDRQKQLGTVDKNRLHLSDWKGCDSIGAYGLQISSVRAPYFNPLQAISSSTVYLYGKPKGFDMQIPLERLDHGIVETSQQHSIGCGDKIYYLGNMTTTVWENGNLIIKFGKSMSIKILFYSGNRIGGTFHYDLKGSLNNALSDCGFILDVFSKRSIMINSIPIGFTQIDKAMVDQTVKLNQEYNAIRKKMNDLKIFDDLFIEQLSDDELWKIKLLLEINGETESKHLANFADMFTLLNIANVRLTLFVFFKEGKLFVLDVFSELDQFNFGISDDNGDHHSISRFICLTEDALLSSNLFAEYVYLNIVKYDTWDHYQNYINAFLLVCLKAVDTGMGNHDELYKLASLLSEWLLGKDPESEIYQLNYLQTCIRKRPLTEDEGLLVEKLSSVNDESWAVKCGALILSADHAKAMQLLEKQPREAQEEFKLFPIYSLLPLTE